MKEIIATTTILINYNISKLYKDGIIFLYIKQSCIDTHSTNSILYSIYISFLNYKKIIFYDFVSILNVLNCSLYAKALFFKSITNIYK
jgi:hypothetical protein